MEKVHHAMKAQTGRNIHIAVLDSDPAVLDYAHKILAGRFTVSLFTEATELTRNLRDRPTPDLLLMDWNIAQDSREETSLSLVARIHAWKPLLQIIMFSCSAELKDVVLAGRMGVADVILKPFTKADMDFAVEHCLSNSQAEPADEGTKEVPLNENVSFVRASRAMLEVESQCRLVARADIPVLVLGESGTGKEIAAMLIHKLSPRSQRSFLKVNCAAMPADLLESELFGYEQGAFTGAVKSKPGKFEICDHGTILLDEIGEMPTVLQAKLLQVLQDGSFSRLGGRTSIKVDVRVIAATNIDIKAAIAQKKFREDLYYRLNGFTLKIPPLRDRIDEIPVLSRHFMQKAATKYQCDPLPISPSLLRSLTSYSWPGNLRELENMIKRYIVLADELAIIDELGLQQFPGSSPSRADEKEGSGGLKYLVRHLKGDAEAVAIANALEATGWNRKAAASGLQISYKALLYKIKQYNLTPPMKQYGLEPIARGSISADLERSA
jgi:DNA-binding NtrC family response regulator